MKRTVLYITGYATVGLAFAGAFLPLLPTTPFLLIALWCFSKSSPRMQRWMLSNPLFGQYLKAYRAGKGIPPRVKIWVLTLMWGTILFSALYCTQNGWVRGGLVAIALLVSIHILKLSSGRKKATILWVTPTQMEADAIQAELPEATIEVIGIGATCTVYHTLKALAKHTPQRIILAGIAGTYNLIRCPIGSSVIVTRERWADAGAFESGSFVPKFGTSYTCSYLPSTLSFPTADSNTLNAGAAPYASHDEALIENMEGAAFFYTCLQEKIPFLELRTLSNRVGEPFAQWNIKAALAQLGKASKKLNDEINT